MVRLIETSAQTLESLLSDVLDLEAMNMVRTMMTDDHKAASQAFVEKRAPVFEGR